MVDRKGNLQKFMVFPPQQDISPVFLQQFSGKTPKDLFRAGQDIRPESLAPELVQSLANGARRGLLVITELFKK